MEPEQGGWRTGKLNARQTIAKEKTAAALPLLPWPLPMKHRDLNPQHFLTDAAAGRTVCPMD